MSRKNRLKGAFPITVSNKLQGTKATKSHPPKQFQASVGTISKQILQPELEESSALDLLHSAGITLGRRYFFPKQSASEFIQSMVRCSTTKPGFRWIKPPHLRVHSAGKKKISRSSGEMIMNPSIVNTAQPSYAEFPSRAVISLSTGTAGKRWKLGCHSSKSLLQSTLALQHYKMSHSSWALFCFLFFSNTNSKVSHLNINTHPKCVPGILHLFQSSSLP